MPSVTELLRSSDVTRANRNKEREALGKAYKALKGEVTACFGESQGSNLCAASPGVFTPCRRGIPRRVRVLLLVVSRANKDLTADPLEMLSRNPRWK